MVKLHFWLIVRSQADNWWAYVGFFLELLPHTGAQLYLGMCSVSIQVVGVDYSGRFIDTALAIQDGKTVEYGEGQVASLQMLEGVRPLQVAFKQVDDQLIDTYMCVLTEAGWK